MKKLLSFIFLIAQVSSVYAHWDDEFDLSTGLVTSVVHTYKDASLNTPEGRNHFRTLAQVQTENIRLTPLVPAHTEIFYNELFTQPQTMTYYETGKPRDLATVTTWTTRWINRWDVNPFSWWALFHKETDAFIGGVGSYYDVKDASLEIACLLIPAAEGRGHMSEALQGLIPYAQKALADNEIPCPAIGVPIDPENERSCRLAERMGLVHDTSRDYYSRAYQRHRLWYSVPMDLLAQRSASSSAAEPA